MHSLFLIIKRKLAATSKTKPHDSTPTKKKTTPCAQYRLNINLGNPENALRKHHQILGKNLKLSRRRMWTKVDTNKQHASKMRNEVSA